MTTEYNHNFTCDLCGERLRTGFHKGFLKVKFIDKKVKINHLRTKHNYSISKIIVWLIKCICKRFKRIDINKK